MTRILAVDGEGRIIIPKDMLRELEVEAGGLLEATLTPLDKGFELNIKKALTIVHTGK